MSMSEAKADAGQELRRAAVCQSACLCDLLKAARHASQILQLGILLLLCIAASMSQNAGIATHKEGWTNCSGERDLMEKHMHG